MSTSQRLRSSKTTWAQRWIGLGLLSFFLTACAPTPEGNVIGYYLARRLGTLHETTTANVPTGAFSGTVVDSDGQPIAGATVLVAARTGKPYATQTDAEGRYVLGGIPRGQYVPSAVAPGYDESVPKSWFDIPTLVTVAGNITSTLPPLVLQRHEAAPLPTPLPSAVNLVETANYTATSPFPDGAEARVLAFQFDHAEATVDSLRVYLPTEIPDGRQLPMLFMIYPTAVDGWETVSVAFAAAGYAFVAISPISARALAIDEHAQDARVALALARGGYLDPAIAPDEVIMLGGSFSSPILNRLMRDEREAVAAWINVGGVSNAFLGTEDFYSGALEMPPQYELLIPALGPPNLYPLFFLRYSPAYTAAQLPPTLIIHTAADKVTPINQAYELEAALKQAGVPLEVFYYEDVSHYLQIGDDLTEAGKQMYNLILDFAQRYQSLPPYPGVSSTGS